MTLSQAIQILKHHQKWRLGEDTTMTDPKELTEAIDTLINQAENPNKPSCQSCKHLRG